MIYLTNAFSVHMLPHLDVDEGRKLNYRRISPWEAGNILRSHAFRSFYGHGASAFHLAKYLRIEIPVSRGFVELKEGDTLIIAAITGKRKWEAGYKPFPGWLFYEVTIAQ